MDYLKYQIGTRLSASDQNRRAEDLDVIQRYSSGGYGKEGRSDSPNPNTPIRAKIIGVTFGPTGIYSALTTPTRPTYLWQLVDDVNTEGTFPGTVDNTYATGGVIYSDDANGTFTLNYPAYEATNNPNVPVDGSVIIELSPGLAGAYYTFNYPREFVLARLTSDQTFIPETNTFTTGQGYAWYELQPSSGPPSTWKQFPPKNGGLQGGFNTSMEITGNIGIGGATVSFATTAGVIDDGSVVLINQGSNYPPNSTFNLSISGGSGTGGIITAHSDANGQVSTVEPDPVASGTDYVDTEDCPTKGPLNIIAITNVNPLVIISQLFVGQQIFCTSINLLLNAPTTISDIYYSEDLALALIYLSRDANDSATNGTFIVQGNTGNVFTLRSQAISIFSETTNYRITRGFCTGYPNITINTIQQGNGEVREKFSLVITNATSGTFFLIINSSSTGEFSKATVPIVYNVTADDLSDIILAACSDSNFFITVEGFGTALQPCIITFGDGLNYPPPMVSYVGTLGSSQTWLLEDAGGTGSSGLNFVWETPGPQIGQTIEVFCHLEDQSGNRSYSNWTDIEITITDDWLNAGASPTAFINQATNPVGIILEGQGTGSVRMRFQNGLLCIAVTSPINEFEYAWGDQSRNSQEYLKAKNNVLQLQYVTPQEPLFQFNPILRTSVAVSSSGGSGGVLPVYSYLKTLVSAVGGGGASNGCCPLGNTICLFLQGVPAQVTGVDLFIPGYSSYNLTAFNGLHTLILDLTGVEGTSSCQWSSDAFDLNGTGTGRIYITYINPPAGGPNIFWTVNLGVKPYSNTSASLFSYTYGAISTSTPNSSPLSPLPVGLNCLNPISALRNLSHAPFILAAATRFFADGTVNNGNCSGTGGLIPIVTSINPTNGPTAGGTTVTITGSNFISADNVFFGITPATSFIINSDTQITAVSPAGTVGTVDVTVTNAAGVSGQVPGDQFTYYTASVPTVTSVSPDSGGLAGGIAVTITGTNFIGTTSVLFGSDAATSFTVDSAIQITAVNPSNDAGTVDVTVTTPAGTSATSTADEFTYYDVPLVTSVDPNHGSIAGGTTVTITGINFFDASSVAFGVDLATSFIYVSSTQITAVSPAHSAGTVDVTVTTPVGTSATSSADEFTYGTGPAVTLINPTSGPIAGGTTVTITGTTFTGTSQVYFGSTVAASYIVDSNTQIRATSPAHSAGTVDITIVNGGITSTTSTADQYTFIGGPNVTLLGSAAGSTAGGQITSIYGNGFLGATDVKFGATSALAFTVISNSVISATVPPHSAAIVDVTVTTPSGTSPAVPEDQYTYYAPPTVTNVSPDVGPVSGGTTVTITGTNFILGAVVKFIFQGSGGAYVSPVTIAYDSSTQLTVVTSSTSVFSGLTDIVVTTQGGPSAISSNDEFYYGVAPVVTAISPASGSITGGTTVTITGTSLASASAVKFGSTDASSYVVDSATQIRAVSPAQSGIVDITVTTPAGTSATSAADVYTYSGSAISFAGNTGSHMTASDAGLPSGSNDRTITFWGKWITFGGGPLNSMFCYGTNSTNEMVQIGSTGASAARIGLPDQLAGSAVSAATKYFIVATFTGGTWKLYINNTLWIDIPHTTNTTLGQGVFFGTGGNNGGFYPGNIAIQDVRVYNRVINSTERGQIYNSGVQTFLDGVTSGLTNWWKCAEGTGGTIEDSTGSNDGTLTSATWTTM